MLHDNYYLCLLESNKQQNKKVKSKTKVENSQTKATPRQIWIRLMYGAAVAFSKQKDKNEEIINFT